MSRFVGVLILTFALTSFGQVVTSPTPANVVFVPNPSGYNITKHPSLPVLYLGCYYAPESKNLITYPLHADGTVNTNGMRGFNYFSDNPTNELWRYSVQRPLVLSEERVLYLAAIPSQPNYLAHSNHQEVAAVSLDDAGQPSKILKAIRTTHSEKEIRGWEFDPTSRRLYLSYHTYFGWIPIGKDGVMESDKFTYIWGIQTCWQWVLVPEWQRFFARQTDSGMIVARLSSDGTAPEFLQSLMGTYRGVGTLAVSREFSKVYFLDTQGGRLVMYPVTKDGRITGVPRFFPVGEAYGARIDFKAKRLYVWYDKTVLRVFPLNDRGDPVATPQLHALECGAIRDVLLDEPSGKLYVVCNEIPKLKTP